MVTSFIAFNFVENGYLEQAFAALGVKPLTRYQISGPMLDNLASQDKTAMMETIASMDVPAGSRDSWRKKSCQDGAGLMNTTVLGDSCMPLYFTPVKASSYESSRLPRHTCNAIQSHKSSELGLKALLWTRDCCVTAGLRVLCCSQCDNSTRCLQLLCCGTCGIVRTCARTAMASQNFSAQQVPR
jgi:hypothetical protein